jgi:hypothetical protein
MSPGAFAAVVAVVAGSLGVAGMLGYALYTLWRKFSLLDVRYRSSQARLRRAGGAGDPSITNPFLADAREQSTSWRR